MIDNSGAELIAAQLRHTIDLLRFEVRDLRKSVDYIKEFQEHRLNDLESNGKDHETRIKNLNDGVTQFKMVAGLANGGSGLLSIIAVVKAFFGG